ncbi:hypothetical protein FAIPA1_180047 [Frankia sp. AiPs1]|uniref:nSTAND1 domain-containing NTPase n=1 Tax=Frankia sp. AiPa1 TaxID=573492 RepID=UPI00202B336D|nr:SUMF1/EgtB/PvdO family nonheme iron enzyme [Frankia sp. AiPa1]MCL9759573.1 SUMF1/EgtB/PvdO family nonheme iron enzyme [Frankia sp. AiPa1]
MGSRTEYRFDVFVVYAARDEWWVHGFLLPALAIPESRIVTEGDFQPGAVLLAEFAAAVIGSRFTVVVLTPDFLVDGWADLSQRLAAHLSVDEQRNRLVPILLRPCELPLDLAARVRLDCTRPAGWEPAAARLRTLLHSTAPAAAGIPCPYPGLLPYAESDAALFFGRDAEIARIVQLVRRAPEIFVIGPSGSGKSSLVSAGVLPDLARREPDGWLSRTMRPGADPMAVLRETLQWPGSRSLADAMSDLTERHYATRLLLVVDQLEEMFVQAPAADRAEFLRALRLVARETDRGFLCVLRADFYPDLMGCELWPVPAGQRVEIVPPRGQALRAAIERPARHRGVHLEPALVERLVADVAAEPGTLPLLQETLRRLWEDRQQRVITLDDYQAAGRDGLSAVATALATWADASLAGLSADQQAVARRIFLRLVHLGDGRDDTRRRQSVDALRVAGEQTDAFDEVLRRLVERRLVTVSGTEGEDIVVDLAHEAVITAWPALCRWVTDGREAELLRRRIERDAHEWQRAGRHRTLLYRGRRLHNAREWRSRYAGEPSRTVLRFLAASRRLDLALRAIAALTAAAALAGVAWLLDPVARRWELHRRAVAASPMVHLAGGPTVLGGLGQTGARGEQVRALAPFAIDRHEVSNRQYRLCVQARVCSRPLEPAEYQGIDTRPDRPVVYVTAYQAAQFCQWLGRTLPTGAQWERAARGQQGRPWPWGRAAPTPPHANVASDAPDTVIPDAAITDVTDRRFAAGWTPEGIADLIGNVWEWTSSPSTCDSTPYSCNRPWNGRDRVGGLEFRGSSFKDIVTAPTFISETDANQPLEALGFRCARNG